MSAMIRIMMITNNPAPAPMEAKIRVLISVFAPEFWSSVPVADEGSSIVEEDSS